MRRSSSPSTSSRKPQVRPQPQRSATQRSATPFLSFTHSFSGLSPPLGPQLTRSNAHASSFPLLPLVAFIVAGGRALCFALLGLGFGGIYCSEAYGGSGLTFDGERLSEDVPCMGQGQSIQVLVPPLGVLVLALDDGS